MSAVAPFRHIQAGHMGTKNPTYIFQVVKALAKTQSALGPEATAEIEDGAGKPEEIEQSPEAPGLRHELPVEVESYGWHAQHP